MPTRQAPPVGTANLIAALRVRGFPFQDEIADFALEPGQVGWPEAVKGGNGARLEEVRHDRNSPAARNAGGGTNFTASGATSS